ncbi:MAG: aminotransferase class I/II-fold pyridoxal phosphate-dependent enzyme [Clostridia bacterium]|nr:aminotransferase class I/II-fold pyridoxal phosphate-dependent enzyme [Clostridia bacterium]
MFRLNDKVKNLTPYEPISGTYEIRLDANESFLTVPEEIENEMVEALKNSALNRYPDPMATKLLKGFADYFNVDPDCVTAGNGSDEIISVIMNAFLQKGDKILTLEPDFSMYRFYAEIAECESVKYQKNENLDVNIDDVIDMANKENVRIVILSNPCNPTSRIIKADEIRKLINNTNALVVLDEAYMDFAVSESLMGEFQNYDNLIILKTCSKALGCAALRLGFAVANKTLTNVIRAVKSPYNVNSVSQALGEVLFSHPDYIDSCIETVVNSKKELYAELLKIESEKIEKIYETHTNFVFMKAKNAKQIFEKMK